MDDARFWKLVEAAKTRAGDNDNARPALLRADLAALDAAAIQSFQRTYDQLLLRAYRWDLWGAAWLMNLGGCSDDGFRYFRDWLISEGRATYERALDDPDSLADQPARDFFELESFGHAAREAYAEHTDVELEGDVTELTTEPEGEEWDPDDLPALLPRLAAKYPA